jgi:tetratricopeptide (TPR) repeat protein
MTIFGLGGCGKSALALEFAYRTLARQAMLVFWVPAISQESFDLAYREIGIRLRIPGITDDNADFRSLVKETLSSESAGDWLIIVDNADDPGVLLDATTSDPTSARLSDCLPHSKRGTILFTTRSRKAAAELTQSNVLGLSEMNTAEARQLLARRITKQSLLNDERAVDELLELLTHLPLAMVQASAFINNNDISVSGYISLFRHAGTETELFSENFKDPGRYQEVDSTIARTWHISFNQIRRQDWLAAEYLSFMACIDRINIPQSLLPPKGTLVEQVKALGTLTGYAFITEHRETAQSSDTERFFDMHRLVHMASGWWLDGHNKRATWADAVIARLEELIPYGGHEKREKWTTYLSHAIYVAGPHGMGDELARASLLWRVGMCQASLGQYSAAEATHRQVLWVREKKLGRDNEQTIQSMNDVGGAFLNQGKYEEAISMIRQTLALSDRVLGPENTETLMSLNNLAVALDSLGKYDESETMNRQTLARREKMIGPEHPYTLMSMSNLALVLDRLGKFEEAESINRLTLARREKVLTPGHPDTLMSMNNLALVLDSQGKYEEAESIHRKTLVQREKVIGSEHPDTLMSMSNLAVVLENQGKHEEAETINKQTLARREKVLGPEHPDTLMSMSNLGLVLESQYKYKEAEIINRKTLALREKMLGPKHPETLMSVYCLAHLLAEQNRYDESFILYERAYTAYDIVLGKDHPTTRACQDHYSELLVSQGRDPIPVPAPTSPEIRESGTKVHSGKRAKFSRGLAKISIRSSRFFVK